MRTCVLIPNYNHGATLSTLLSKLELYRLPCIIIDDGSNRETKLQLENAIQSHSWVSLITLPHNQGKGAALSAGFKKALNLNFTHAIQIDADAQHDTQDIPKFLTEIEKNPNALITGKPIYDHSIPKGRLYGRKITNFWVCLETLSFSIKDAMCGYRAYPLQQTIQIMKDYSVDKRMSFDIEIIVRFYWNKNKIISIPTKVIYPPGGISHFKLWRDNLHISWAHTRLFFGMLKRLPNLLIYQHNNKQINEPDNHWSQAKEKGSAFGLKFTLYSYKLLGYKVTRFLLYPIITYFYCFCPTARNASKQYLLNLENSLHKIEETTFKNKNTQLKHFLNFGEMILDKLSVWNNDITTENIAFPNKPLFIEQIEKKKGGVIFTAHLGNIEIARSLSRFVPDLKINALVFNNHVKNFNAILEQINSECTFNIINVSHSDITLAFKLKEKINSGEFIVIACDRTSTNQPHRCIKTRFLNKDTALPQGPFILAGLLQCPIYFMLCLKEKEKSFKIIFEKFADSINIRKKTRSAQLKIYAQKYAQLLEAYCQQYPLQWFNFFDFWKPIPSPLRTKNPILPVEHPIKTHSKEVDPKELKTKTLTSHTSSYNEN